MGTEADRCRKLAVLKLQAAGWDNEPHSVAEQRYFTTGLEAPRCRNVALVRLVNSMVEFKQTIGRGTRACDDYGKLWFNILDYTGTATRNFADPAFDGDPTFATQEEIDEYGRTKHTEILTAENAEDTEKNQKLQEDRPPYSALLQSSAFSPQPSKRSYFHDRHVEIAAELVHERDADGKQLRVVKLTDYTAQKVRTRAKKAKGLRLNAKVNCARVSAFSLQPSTFPHSPPRQRADRVKRQQAAFFNYYQPEAREILAELLEKYASDGELPFTLPDVLQIPPITRYGNVNEIISKLGGADQLRGAVNQLQLLLYAR